MSEVNPNYNLQAKFNDFAEEMQHRVLKQHLKRC